MTSSIPVSDISLFIIMSNCAEYPCQHETSIAFLSERRMMRQVMSGDQIWALADKINDKSKIIGNLEHFRKYANAKVLTLPTADNVSSLFEEKRISIWESLVEKIKSLCCCSFKSIGKDHETP